MKQKIKKIAPIILVICLIYIIAVNVSDKVKYSNLTFEERILEVMNTNDFMSETGEGSADKIVYLEEVDGGYFCIATSSEFEEISFGYIKDNDGELEYAGESFGQIDSYIYNEDPTLTYSTSILNFSDTEWYYGLYQHKEGTKVTVNGEEVPIQSLSVEYKGESFDMDFWLVRSDEKPSVEAVSES